MSARRTIVLAIAKIMAFVGWTMMAMRHVHVLANGSVVVATVHRFALISAAIVVRPIQSTNACKQSSKNESITFQLTTVLIILIFYSGVRMAQSLHACMKMTATAPRSMALAKMTMGKATCSLYSAHWLLYSLFWYSSLAQPFIS